jgi:cytoskeletal protein RodZ
METAAASVGDRLRAAREAKGLELSHIAAETRIPERHLDSIERSDFDALPSRTYAIGFARTYARIVGLDEKEITNAVREELAGGEGRHSRVSGGMEPGDPAKLPSTGLAWFGGIAALILAIGVISFFSTYYGAGADLPSLIAEGEGAVQEIAANEAATSDAEATAQAAPTSEGQVVFTATGEGAWVRFYEEGGERLFEGVMEDGDTYEVPRDAEDPRLNTGRPNLFDITIDGQQVPPLTEEMVPVASAPVSAAALLSRGQGEDVATNES